MNHIALVIPGLDRIAGAERQVMTLAKGLRSRGWRVSVIALTGEGGLAAAELRSAGIEFQSLQMHKGLLDPRGWIRFHRWVKRERPQVIHAHLHHAAWLARWSRLFFAIQGFLGFDAPDPVLIDTFHSSSTGGLVRRLGYRASDWLVDCVTAVSQSAADAHIVARMVDPRKISVLYNGVDVEQFQPDAGSRAHIRRKFGLNDEFLWLAAGRLEPVKDYPTLLNAFAALPPNARLLIAGEGSRHDALRQLCERLGLESRVRFLGFQPDIRPLMHAADAFVLSSRWEGLPVGLIEAGACALPSIATDVLGSREVIVRGRTGRLTPSVSPCALARTMTAMMYASPRERRAMGNLARLHVTERFSLDSALDRWETLYATRMARGYLTHRGVGDPLSA